VLFLIAASLFFGAVTSQTNPMQATTDEWPMFHNDLNHTGSSESTAPKTNQILWRFNTGGPVDSPVVSDGIVYFGSLDDNFYALNASNGDFLWNYTTRANVLSPAAIAEGRVYFGSEDFNVYALNASTGEFIWSFKTGYFVDSAIAITARSPTLRQKITKLCLTLPVSTLGI
jgi:hypothetical protein